jgi:hypothetical protein
LGALRSAPVAEALNASDPSAMPATTPFILVLAAFRLESSFRNYV